MAFFDFFWHFSSIFNIIQPKIPFFRHFLFLFVFANVSRGFQIFVVYNRFNGRVNVFCYFQSTCEAYYFKRALKEGFLIFSPNIFLAFNSRDMTMLWVLNLCSRSSPTKLWKRILEKMSQKIFLIPEVASQAPNCRIFYMRFMLQSGENDNKANFLS